MDRKKILLVVIFNKNTGSVVMSKNKSFLKLFIKDIISQLRPNKSVIYASLDESFKTL